MRGQKPDSRLSSLLLDLAVARADLLISLILHIHDSVCDGELCMVIKYYSLNREEFKTAIWYHLMHKMEAAYLVTF